MTLSIDYCDKDQFDEHIDILPSDRIYFDDYPYRVTIKGPGFPNIDYDPLLHFEITQFMKSCNLFWKRDINRSTGRCIYFGSYEDLLWFCAWQGEHVLCVHGPINDEHISSLFTPGIMIREQLFFNKYDYRIEFCTGFNYSSKVQSDIESIKLVVEQNLDNYRWGTSHFNWYYNYLYCNHNDFKDVEGFFKLSCGKIAINYDKVKLFSEL